MKMHCASYKLLAKSIRLQGVMDDHGNAQKFIVVDTNRDGNCLFRALSIALSDS